MTDDVDLDKFRHAPTLRWHPHTVFEPGKGADGTLFADDGGAYLPLDIWSERETDIDPESAALIDDVGMVASQMRTVADAQESVRAWCREQLGRDDIEFDPWEERRG